MFPAFQLFSRDIPVPSPQHPGFMQPFSIFQLLYHSPSTMRLEVNGLLLLVSGAYLSFNFHVALSITSYLL